MNSLFPVAFRTKFHDNVVRFLMQNQEYIRNDAAVFNL